MYIGRFAPSPTGPLHFGSLLAASSSYLEARSQRGKWLLRIEDLDKPREVPGAANDIIQTLAQYGFNWDDNIVYQSQRIPAYQNALEQLAGLTYPCTCSRRTLREQAVMGTLGLIYPGTCRSCHIHTPERQYSIRIQVPAQDICFNDTVQGSYCQNLSRESGDFIIRRADGLFAYQLAVVVDDEWQGITHIVRGADLLDNTPRQIHLQRSLGYSTPQYLHIPLASYDDGQKLSKHTHAPAIRPHHTRDAILNLCRASSFLGQTPPPADDFSQLDEYWQWAVTNWDKHLIPGCLSMLYPGGICC